MRFKRSKNNAAQIVFFFFSFCLLLSSFGCEALVKKFTRKPKGDQKEEIVLVPEDYTGDLTPEQRYRQYFLFWKSWQDELIESLLQNRSLKKKVDCAEQALKNLQELRNLLNEDKQALLDKYINDSERLKNAVSSDIYGNNNDTNRGKAESIKRYIVRYFTYTEIKDCMR